MALKEWLKKARSLRLPDLLAVLRRKLQGYWNYYGVRGNSTMLGKYQYEVHRLLLQVAEPPKPAALDDMEELQRTLENVGYARSVVETFPSPILRQSPKPA